MKRLLITFPRWIFARCAGCLLLAVLLNGSLVVRVFASSFRGLGDLSGGTVSSVAMAVSATGQVVVGYSSSTSGYQAFRWTATGGMVGLGDLPGGTFSSFANAVSADGAVVVGQGTSAAGGEAFRWTQSSGMVGLGDLPGGSFGSCAQGVSANGQVIVGFSCSALSGTRDEAFQWTATNGMVALGDLPGGNYSSRAWAVSADGSVIAGESSSSNSTSEAFRWTAGTGMVGLGDFPGGWTNSIAYGISADGSVVVGRGYSGAFDDYTHEAFRWTAASGLVRLGFIPCSEGSIAHAVSADGSIIVGDPESGLGGDCAFIWDAQHGMRNLHEVLAGEHGLDLTGWQLIGARGISADGLIIVGYGTNPSGNTEAWIANLNPPLLEIAQAGTRVILSWKTNAPGFILELTSSLTLPDLWDSNSAPASLVGDRFVVTNDLGAGQRFFRLRKP